MSGAVTDLVSLLLLGFFLGMRHATDADHVIAIATIVSRQRTLRGSVLIGAAWGIGHTLTILAVGSAIILFGVVIPARVGLAMELAVGIMLVILGLLTLTGMGRVLRDAIAPGRPLLEHAHAHGHDLAVHDHAHAHGDYVHQHAHGHDARDHGHPADQTPLARLDRNARHALALSMAATARGRHRARARGLGGGRASRARRRARSDLGDRLPASCSARARSPA